MIISTDFLLIKIKICIFDVERGISIKEPETKSKEFGKEEALSHKEKSREHLREYITV